MRYERLDWELSTAACSAILNALEQHKEHQGAWGYSANAITNAELYAVANELRARLQRKDVDAQAPKNFTDPNADLVS